MISPVLMSLGPIQIRWYGLVYALAFGAFYYIMRKYHKDLGLSQDESESLVTWSIVGLLVGARLFHFLIDNPMALVQNPLEFFFIWHGGMSFYGATIGLIASAWIFASRHPKMHLWQTLDLGALVGACAIIFGRIANFINQELVGRVTDVSWCVHFDTALGCRHPYQLYAAASHFVLFSILLLLFIFHPGFKARREGLVFSAFILGYGILRFIVDFWRDDQMLLMGLTAWQFFSLLVTAIGAVLLVRRIWKGA